MGPKTLTVNRQMHRQARGIARSRERRPLKTGDNGRVEFPREHGEAAVWQEWRAGRTGAIARNLSVAGAHTPEAEAVELRGQSLSGWFYLYQM
jgi:hypothetical protein